VPDVDLGSSIEEGIARAAEVLGAAGIADPRREALRVWSAIAGESVGTMWLRRECPADPRVRERAQAAVQRRVGGMPFAYAVGCASFRTLELLSDDRALIPRPETEGLVALVLQWAGQASGGTAADAGTGSGCIALALAVEGHFDRVIATDRSPRALALARENVERVHPSVPVDLRRGDWLAPVAPERCRVIVANPPYLREDEWAALEPGVRDAEPREALASGPDGLAATRTLLRQAGHALVPGGLLALEIDERRATSVAALARGAGWRHVAIHHDLFGRPRYVLAVARGDS
jgi:release factor glutamine methyltransferase